MTDDLIDRLAGDLKPTPRRGLLTWLGLALLVGAVAAFAVMLPWLGLRPDFPRAFSDMTFWGKFAYTTAFAGFGIWAALRLSRPGGDMRRPAIAVVGLVALTGLAGIVQVMMSPPEAIRGLMMGSTALVCPIYIVALSVPVFIAIVVAMRRLAPTNLTLAGFAAGLAAGGVACWVYAFHCGENGMPFITIWYTAGILAAALIGAALGRVLLRW